MSSEKQHAQETQPTAISPTSRYAKARSTVRGPVPTEGAPTGAQITEVREMLDALEKGELDPITFVSCAATSVGTCAAEVAARDVRTNFEFGDDDNEINRLSSQVVESACAAADHIPPLLYAIERGRFNEAWEIAQSLRDIVRDELYASGEATDETFYCWQCNEEYSFDERADSEDENGYRLCVRCAASRDQKA